MVRLVDDMLVDFGNEPLNSNQFEVSVTENECPEFELYALY